MKFKKISSYIRNALPDLLVRLSLKNWSAKMNKKGHCNENKKLIGSSCTRQKFVPYSDDGSFNNEASKAGLEPPLQRKVIKSV